MDMEYLLDREAPPGLARVSSLRTAIKAKSHSEIVSLAMIARAIRRVWAPRRRFSDPVYIKISSSKCIVTGDAFSEVILGKDGQEVSYSNQWPKTLKATMQQEQIREFWKEYLGLEVANETISIISSFL